MEFSARSWDLISCGNQWRLYEMSVVSSGYTFRLLTVFTMFLKSLGLWWQDWAWNKVTLSYFFPLQRSGGFLPTVSTNVVLRAYLRLNKRRSNSIQWKSRRSSTVLRNSHHYFSNVLLFRGSQSSGTVSSQNCQFTPIFDSKWRKH